MCESATYHKFYVEHLRGDADWQVHLRALTEATALEVVTEMRELTNYPWRIVKVTITEEVLDDEHVQKV